METVSHASASYDPAEADTPVAGTRAWVHQYFDQVLEHVSRRVGAGEAAQLVTIEAIARVVEGPLFPISLRYRLPVEPLLKRAVDDVMAEWSSGGRPPVA